MLLMALATAVLYRPPLRNLYKRYLPHGAWISINRRHQAPPRTVKQCFYRRVCVLVPRFVACLCRALPNTVWQRLTTFAHALLCFTMHVHHPPGAGCAPLSARWPKNFFLFLWLFLVFILPCRHRTV